MLGEQRRQLILDKIRREGQVQTADLAREIGVAEETIRRDIRVMSRENLVRKVHGGATGLLRLDREQPYEQRGQHDARAKQCIGQYAAGLIRDSEIIALDGGGATEWMARSLMGQKNLTLVTNSLPTAMILSGKLSRGEITGRLILLGGQVYSENQITHGALCMESIRRFCFHKAFLGVSALGEQGPMVWEPEEGAASAGFACQAQQTILLAESAKGQRSSLYTFMDYQEVRMLITDGEHELDDGVRRALERAGVERITLETEGT